MKRIIYLFYLILGCLLTIPLKATLLMDKCNLPDLSNNAILCMHQDRDHYVWFGTYDGLNLYNGTDSYVFRFEQNNENSLCSNIIHKITDAEPGYLWIATSLGINKFSLDKRAVVESYPGYLECSFLATDRKGNTLAVCKDGFLSGYSLTSGGFRDLPDDEISPSTVKSLFTDSENTFMMVLASGKLRTLETDFSEQNFRVNYTDREIHSQPISYATVEGQTLYLVDEQEVLYQYDLRTGVKQKLADLTGMRQKYGSVINVMSHCGRIFVFFREGYFVDAMTSQVALQTGFGVFCVMKDQKQNLLWIGTDGNGVHVYYDKPQLFGSLLASQFPMRIYNPVRGLFTDPYKNLWIGTKGDGLYKISHYDTHVRMIPASSVTKYTINEGLPSNRVYCCTPSQDTTRFWIGSDGIGISYYSYKDKRIHTLVQGKDEVAIKHVHAIAEINDSTLWLATTNVGLLEVHLQIQPSQLKIRSVTSYLPKHGTNSCNEFQSLYYDGDSLLYAGTRGGYGVLCMNVYTKNYRFAKKNFEDHSAIGDVLSICRSSDSLFYIGASSGMSLLGLQDNRATYLYHYNRNDGIGNDMIHGILEGSDQSVWMSTNKGLTQYNPKNKLFHSYIGSGLEVVEFSDDSYWKCPYTGRLFFGGVNGLVWVNQQHPFWIDEGMDLHFFNARIEDTYMPLDSSLVRKGLRVAHDTREIQVSFAVPDYINIGNYEYAYCLEGFSPSWNELRRGNKITLSWLPPGDYRLKVRFRLGVSDYTDKEYVLPITVLPPWYQTTYAKVGYGFLAILLLFFLHLLYRRQLRRKQQVILQAMDEKQKQKLYEAKLNFFTHITHELCTPLTLITGVDDYLQQYSAQRKDSKLQSYSRILRENVLELNHLIQEILDFRKVEDDGFRNVKFAPASISDFLQHECERFEALIEQRKIHFHLQVASGLNWNTDILLVKKIFSNLLSNAFKYTPEGGEIRVSAAIENEILVFRVYNTGKGIPQEEREHIFDRYYLLKDEEAGAATSMQMRTGLGLFICFNLVQLLKGYIDIESEEGQYAEFIVSLPAQPLEESALPEELEPEETPVPADTKQKELILVVDDHKDITWMISDVLSSDYRVHVEHSATSALAFLKQETPVLLITDIMMPGMNGLDLLTTLKQDKYLSHISVVIVSAMISEKEQAEGLNRGADAYLTKPFSSVVLKSTVDRLVSNRETMKEYYYSPESAFQFSGGQLMHQEDKEFLEKVTAIIKANMNQEGLRPEFIAEQLHMNTRSLYRRFKKISDMTPSDYIKDCKLSYAAQLLVTTNMSVQEILYAIGNTNKSYFYKEFSRKYQVTPKDYRSMNQKIGNE